MIYVDFPFQPGEKLARVVWWDQICHFGCGLWCYTFRRIFSENLEVKIYYRRHRNSINMSSGLLQRLV